MRRMTIPQVRRAALAASGLARPRPEKVDVRHFRRVVRDLDVVQLDSVNVVTRAHELPFFSRLGAYDAEALRRWLWLSREVHECWAHVASLMPVGAQPLLRHRQQENEHPWKGVQRLVEEDPGYVTNVLEQIRDRGALTVSDLDGAGRRSDHYWGWNPGRTALAWLFESGNLAVHERDRTFRAAYDLPDRVLPAEVLAAPDPPRQHAIEALLLRAVRAQAVGTAEDLADHHRLNIVEARAAVDRLARRGDLVEVEVRGWDRPAYTHADLVVPRSVRARALVCPFDPIVWFRPRLQRLFAFDYRIEIYVPAARRQYGYYVLPFVLDDDVVARVDLKADRRAGRLLVRGAWTEDGADPVRTARELHLELGAMAGWLDLSEVEIVDRGDLAPTLRAAAA